jgi:hypothetical protein
MHVPFRIEPEQGKIGKDESEASRGNKPRRIFKEHEPGFALGNNPRDIGPDEALVFNTSALPRVAEGLAGKSRSDDIHAATPRAAVEGGEIGPDRRLR